MNCLVHNSPLGFSGNLLSPGVGGRGRWVLWNAFGRWSTSNGLWLDGGTVVALFTSGVSVLSATQSIAFVLETASTTLTGVLQQTCTGCKPHVPIINTTCAPNKEMIQTRMFWQMSEFLTMLVSCDNITNTVIRLQLGRAGVWIPAEVTGFSLLQNVQNGSEAHLASYTKGTRGSSLVVKQQGH